MDTTKSADFEATVPSGVDEAVGVPGRKWYVAIVKNNTEKSTSEKLERLGYSTYLATQREARIWRNGKRVMVDRIVMPTIVFVKCTEDERKEIVYLPYVNRFMTDRAGNSQATKSKPLAIIPDSQIELLKFMLGNSDTPVEISSRRFRKGDKVRVARGKLKGLEGEVVDLKKDKTELVVGLDYFGCAKLTIETINVEAIK